jgi:hypothetical protein
MVMNKVKKTEILLNDEVRQDALQNVHPSYSLE